MKLLTAEIIKRLEKTPLYSHESTPADETPIIVKFFQPWGRWTWYATEGRRVKRFPNGTYDDKAPENECNDWLFFGLVDGFEKEMGYFLLSELEGIKGPFGLKIERDMHYEGHKLSDVK